MDCNVQDTANRIKITALKLRLRKNFLDHQAAVLGLTSTEGIKAEALLAAAETAKAEFNRVMDQLAVIDPECPGIRL